MRVVDRGSATTVADTIRRWLQSLPHAFSRVMTARADFADSCRRMPDGSSPSVGFCEVRGGRRVAYASAGTGPPLVMVPGWMSHVTELWGHDAAASALRKLSNGHRFVWYDRVGCGLSDRDPEILSLDDDVAQLEAVLKALDIDRCDLLGYSFGGPAAALFAHRHPTRVRHLVLYSTYAYGADLADAAAYQALVDLVRSGWNLSSVALAALFMPDNPQVVQPVPASGG